MYEVADHGEGVEENTPVLSKRGELCKRVPRCETHPQILQTA